MRNYQKKYTARAIFPDLLRLMAGPPGEESPQEACLRACLMAHYRRTGPLLKEGLTDLPDHLIALFRSIAVEASPDFDRATSLMASLAPSERDKLVILPTAALDLMLAILVGYLLQLNEVGEKETSRLADGHSNRSKRPDEKRQQLLEWVHRRRQTRESWKETLQALKEECKQRYIVCPWTDESRLQQDYSDFRKQKGLGTGKRGRPPRTRNNWETDTRIYADT